jgi:putative acetyltransferase
VLIRRESVDDVDAIDAVHAGAFARPGLDGRPPEVTLVRDLRADAGWVPALSLVVEEVGGAIVGHVACTVGAVGDRPALGLGPLGVLPEHQRRGAGSALMHAVLGAADALDHSVVVLLGAVGYYRRFGFGPAGSLGIAAPDPAWGEHFQARRLSAWSPAVTGVFRYAAPFDAV